MVVEPKSLCWLTGRMVPARDGVTWAEEFARYPALKAVIRDEGTRLGKGLKLERARRHAAGQPGLDDTLDVCPTLREGGRVLRATGAAAGRALEAAGAAQRCGHQRGRQGVSNSGHGAPLNRLWAAAEHAFARAEAAEAAWDRARAALELFTAQGRLNDRRRAEAAVAAAVPDLVGTAWAKVRRLWGRRESFTFLDQAADGLATLGLGEETLAALLDLEGLRRPPWRSRGCTPAAAATRAWTLVRTLQLEKTSPAVTQVGAAGRWGTARGVAGEPPGGVRQQCGTEAAVTASEDDAGAVGPEAAVLEPSAVPDRPSQGSDAVRPAGPDAA
jgi:hypothetical protein